MNNFDTLYQAVQKIERGYDANDQGAPAYCGINKAYHPTWQGWALLRQKGLLKQGAFFPDLEPLVIAFYKDFWKPVQVDKISSLPVARLLVDMKTQHGRWARIINAAKLNTSPLPLTKALPETFTQPVIDWINADSATAYRKIAAARLDYAKNIKLNNEADRKGIVSRAQSFVTAAADYFKNNPGSGAGIVVGLLVFFFALKSFK